jgi:hypothetical protein
MNASSGGAAAFCTEAGLVPVVEEGEAVGAKPVLAEDEVSITIHVELHEGCLLVQPAKDRLCRHRAACWPRGAIGLPNRFRVAGSRPPAASGGKLCRQGAAQEAVGGSRVQQALDPVPPC